LLPAAALILGSSPKNPHKTKNHLAAVSSFVVEME
jgi:hypothetical protein